MSVGISEKNSISYLLSRFPERPIVFDVGSNKGQWSDVILDELKENCSIHLFEPNELLLNFTRVKYDYKKNVTYSNLAAFSEDDKELDFFYFTNENNGLSSVYHNPKWDYLPMQRCRVKSITLDSYCNRNNILKVACIKIDVEGAEYDVLKGCEWLLKDKRVACIQIEYSPHYQLTGRTFKDVIDYVEPLGYSIYEWDDEHGFLKVDTSAFNENYELKNYVISCEVLEKYTQLWNNEFKLNTRVLPTFDLVCEIGCFEGLTTNYICDKLLNPGGRVICVDPLEDTYLTENLNDAAVETNNSLPYFKKQYDRFISNTRHQKAVSLIRKKSMDAYEELKDLRFGLIYIDGDHRPEAVYQDGVKYFNCCKVGGYILFDDYTWGDTKHGIDRFLEERGGNLAILIKDKQVLIQKLKDA